MVEARQDPIKNKQDYDKKIFAEIHDDYES